MIIPWVHELMGFHHFVFLTSSSHDSISQPAPQSSISCKISISLFAFYDEAMEFQSILSKVFTFHFGFSVVLPSPVALQAIIPPSGSFGIGTWMQKSWEKKSSHFAKSNIHFHFLFCWYSLVIGTWYLLVIGTIGTWMQKSWEQQSSENSSLCQILSQLSL